MNIFFSIFITFPCTVVIASAGTDATASYSIEALKALSHHQNFNNKIEYQKVIEARKSAQASYLALAPRLTFNSIASLLGGGGVGLLSAVGDLVPFLFPSNWYQAQASQYQAQAEDITKQILVHNTELDVESLANVILRDQNIEKTYKDLLVEIEGLRQDVRIRETLGQYPAGSTDNISTIAMALRSDYLTLSNNLRSQRVELAAMAGISQITAISEVFWNHELYDILHPLSVDRDNATQLAKNRSLEIKQMQLMIKMAESGRSRSIWSWLDPSGNYLTGVGLPWGKTIEVAEAQLTEMKLQADQVKQICEKNVTQSLITYFDSIDHYHMNQENLEVQKSRKFLLTNKILLGGKVDFYGLAQVIQDYLQSTVQLENSLAQYRNTRAQIMRLTLEE